MVSVRPVPWPKPRRKCDGSSQISCRSGGFLPDTSYFAFTATPKNKTLEIFGDPDPQPDGTVKHRAFHTYTMKQAIQEGL